MGACTVECSLFDILNIQVSFGGIIVYFLHHRVEIKSLHSFQFMSYVILNKNKVNVFYAARSLFISSICLNMSRVGSHLFQWCRSTLNTFFVHHVALWLSHFIWWNDVKCVILYRYHKLLQIWRPSVCKMPTKTPCSLGYPPVITHSGLQSHVSFSEVRWGKSVFVFISAWICLSSF